MKNVFVVFLFGIFVIGLRSESLIETVPLAISEIIRDFYLAQSETFDFVIYGSETRNSNAMVDEIIKATPETLPYNVIKVSNNEISCKVNRSAILIFETFLDFIDFHERADLNNEFPKQFHFLVYICDQVKTLEISSISSTPPAIFHFESFLEHATEENVLRLLSYEAFQQPHCREWEEVEINQFSMSSGNWEGKTFFLEKFNNFNGCELYIGIVYPQEPATGIDFFGNGTLREVWGYATKFNEVIGHYLNYSISYNPLNADTRRMYNKTQRTDFSIYVQKQRMKSKSIHSTLPFTATDDIILIARPKPYSILQKIFNFLETFIGMVATTAVAVITIWVFKLSSKMLQKMNEGARIRPLMIRAL